MKKVMAALFLVFVLGFAVVASGCISGGGTTSSSSSSTTTSSSSSTSTATSTAKLPKDVMKIETDKSVIYVGPKDEMASVTPESGGKKVIIVSYVVDKANTPSVSKLMQEGQGFGEINPAFFRDEHVDALVMAARRETDPAIRTELFKGLYILGNKYAPEVILGQNKQLRVYWSWVKGRYYHPTLAERYDLLSEDPNAPVVPIGIGNYKNDPKTYVIGTIGWPESFDPAWTYETFGWEVWHEVGDTLVTYWKEETEQVSPDLAVAWAHNKDGTVWYFVIRDGVKAYDPWDNKVYPINAVDVAFTFWRVQRLGHSVSWMVKTFMDISASQALTEDEFNKILQSGDIIADYKGKSEQVKSLNDLLNLFGYNGKTAGVFKLVLPKPYAPVLGILADPFLSVVSMQYVLGDKYQEALKASDNGKKPDAWAAYVQKGENDATHQLMHKKPVGTGPFYVKEYKENSYIVLEKNPYYWNTANKFGHDRVIYVINNDAGGRVQLFQTATVDTVALPPERINDVKGLTFKGYKDIVQTNLLQPILTFIVFNTQKEPFNNPKVREALAYAIPYDQIIQTVYKGLMVRNWGPIPKPWPGYTEYGITKYTYDPNKAKQMLQEAGIDPTKYKIQLIYNSGNSAREKIMTLLQNVWSQLGFQVTVTSYEWPVYLGKTEKGDYDVYVVGWVPDYLDSDNWVGPFLYGATKFKEVNVQVKG
ncbi:ABC transporter substrate-binding protein [Thermococcus sp.]